MLREFVCLVALVLSAPAFAGFAQTSAPAGWGGSPSQWTFNPPANSPWVNGSAAGGVTQNVGGRAINMPAAMRMAANAGSYAAKAARITPGGIVTAAVASWLLTEGIAWINGQWLTQVPDPYTYGPTYYRVVSPSSDSSTPQAACAKFGQSSGRPYTVFIPPSGCQTGVTEASYNGGNFQGFTVLTVSCAAGSFFLPTGTCGARPSAQTVPATDADWDKFANKPVPDQVANDLDAPMPVGLPALNPDPAGNPQPYRVPVGDPQAMPGTDPATVKQPVVDIVPKPTLDEPWRVDVQPKEIIGTDPNGQQQPGTVPSGEPAPTPLTPEQVQLCESYPDIAACQPLGKVDAAPVIHTETKQLEIEPYGGFGPSTAACPAPRTVSLRGGTFSVSMPFDLLCDFADGIRPIVVGLAWLASVLAWLGLSRKD